MTHDTIRFPSPISGQIVTGTVHADHGTYVTACWDEYGHRATALHKGLILGEVVDPVPAPPVALSLFDLDQVPASVTPLIAVPTVDPFGDAYLLAEISWRGAPVCRLRDVGSQAADSWRAAGFVVRGMGWY